MAETLVIRVLVFRSIGVGEQVVSSCYEILSKTFAELSIELVSEVVYIPNSLYDARRGQYRADGIVYLISGLVGSDEYGILLADVDAYVPGLNFVFGLAIPAIRSAAVFISRLRLWSGYDVFLKRVQKEVLHEFGHLLGLDHCSDRMCVMRFSNTIAEVDAKGSSFCKKCVTKLIHKGVRVSDHQSL